MKLLIALGALASSVTAAALVGESGPAPSDQRRICKSESDIGSRLAKTRRCFTQAEWDARRREIQNATRDVQNRQMVPAVDGKACGFVSC